MAKGAIITGILFMLAGIIIFFFTLKEDWPAMFFPIGLIAIGIFIILLRGDEDKIEERKDKKKK